MSKFAGKEQILAQFKHGQTIMIGGFLNVGAPETLISYLLEKNAENLTLVGNDSAYRDKGIGHLIGNGRVSKIVASYVGANPDTVKLKEQGKMAVELVPQGTLAERIRCSAAGLGGVLTPTGVGTIVEEGKEKKVLDGKTYLLERAIKADVALIKAWKADAYGNLVYRRSSRNFNPLMAGAAKTVIVEAEQIVEVGSLDPDEIMTPGVLVNMILDNKGA